MNERKVHPHAIRDGCGAFCASSIGTDDDGLLIIGYESLDISLEKWSSVKIVHGDIEESLHWIIYTSISFSGFRKRGKAAETSSARTEPLSLACDSNK